MTGLLYNRVAAVTGGSTGIGRAIALEFVRQGAQVAVNHLGGPEDHFPSMRQEASQTQKEDVVDENNAVSVEARLVEVVGDITKPETATQLVEETVRRFGRIDVLVSNAGVCKFEEFVDVSSDLLNHTITTNLTGSFYAVQAAAKQMIAQGPPPTLNTQDESAALPSSKPTYSIIAVSSISALVGGGRQTHYSPTKAGILSLMQSCAVALGKHSIRCNALLPGTIATQMNEEDLSDQSKRAYMESRTPLGRIGSPNDMAGPAVFLASEMSSFVTGSQLLVDGGCFVNLQ